VRRATIITVRTMIVLLLGAAVADLPLPGRSRDRVRIHLVDRSASVLVPGPVESLLPANADEIVASDAAARAGGDVVTWAAFGRTVAFESRTVDASSTDLAGALSAALGRNPTEIVLYTDGRADAGNALFLCRERGVPIHVFPLGPTSVKDVRILRVEAPPDAPPNAPVPVAVVVESTFDVRARIKVGGDSREIDLASSVPARLPFTLPAPGPFRIDLDVKDACDENNHVAGEVFTRSDRRKVLVLSANAPALPGFDVTVAQRVGNLRPYDAVVLDNVALPAADQQALAEWVRTGGGLVLLGGSTSYALGGWSRTPLEGLSPLRMKPDLRIAAVFGIDSSGSMTEDFHLAAQAVLDARGVFDDDDDLRPMIFSREARMLDFPDLRKVSPTGETVIIGGIETARRHLETREAGRKVIILMTDGATKESPEEIRAAIARLGAIRLFVITTKENVPGAAENYPIKNWNEVRDKLHKVAEGMQDLFRVDPGTVDLLAHPVTEGVAPVPLRWINRTTPTLGAQVLATVGRDAHDPVLAIGRAGQGRVAAFTVEHDPRLARLFRQAIDYAAGDGDAGLTLSVDPPMVRARGSGPPRLQVDSDAGPIVLNQVGHDAWEGRLPEQATGTVLVRKGRARAAATIPCPREFEKLGVDRAALERISRETGGRVLSSPAELASLPRPERSAPQSGRTLFLIAALALVFVEMAVSTFWKI
jgi:uncharacterized membrane protein